MLRSASTSTPSFFRRMSCHKPLRAIRRSAKAPSQSREGPHVPQEDTVPMQSRSNRRASWGDRSHRQHGYRETGDVFGCGSLYLRLFHRVEQMPLHLSDLLGGVIQVPDRGIWIPCLAQYRPADVLSQDASILVLSHVLAEPSRQVPLARMTPDSHNPISAVSYLVGLEYHIFAIGRSERRFGQAASRQHPHRVMEHLTYGFARRLFRAPVGIMPLARSRAH